MVLQQKMVWSVLTSQSIEQLQSLDHGLSRRRLQPSSQHNSNQQHTDVKHARKRTSETHWSQTEARLKSDRSQIEVRLCASSHDSILSNDTQISSCVTCKRTTESCCFQIARVQQRSRLTERKLKRSTLSMPSALSCRMTGARLVLCISGTVEGGSFSKSSSGGGAAGGDIEEVKEERRRTADCTDHSDVLPVFSN